MSESTMSFLINVLVPFYIEIVYTFIQKYKIIPK